MNPVAGSTASPKQTVKSGLLAKCTERGYTGIQGYTVAGLRSIVKHHDNMNSGPSAEGVLPTEVLEQLNKVASTAASERRKETRARREAKRSASDNEAPSPSRKRKFIIDDDSDDDSDDDTDDVPLDLASIQYAKEQNAAQQNAEREPDMVIISDEESETSEDEEEAPASPRDADGATPKKPRIAIADEAMQAAARRKDPVEASDLVNTVRVLLEQEREKTAKLTKDLEQKCKDLEQQCKDHATAIKGKDDLIIHERRAKGKLQVQLNEFLPVLRLIKGMSYLIPGFD